MSAATAPPAAPERVVPHDLEAERSVLGTVLVTHGRVLDTIADTLAPEQFFRVAHATIYRAMLAIYGRGEAVDFVTLRHELQKLKALEDVGGPAYIASLADGVPSSTNVPHYARIVRELASKRGVIELANRLLASAYGFEAETKDLVDQAERGLLELSHQAVPGDLVPSSQIVSSIYPVIEALQNAGKPVTGIASGIAELDRYTRGFQRGTLIILAGRPSAGKSSLALQLSLHVAREEPVAFFSVEMSQQEQAFRVLATLAKVDGHHLQCGRLSMFDQQQVGIAMREFEGRKFFLDDTGSLSPLQIRSRARRMKAKHGLGLIVVDYLQLLNHGRAESREQQVAQTARLLKQIARELDVPLIALCQLSRAAEQSTDKRPQLSHLRESGAIEQDADVVLLIHRPPAKSNGVTTDIPPAELIIAKSRNGPTASIDLRWQGDQYRFEEMEARS